MELALANLEKMLHRAGSVDGEGDGCGILVDIPRKLWAEEVRSGAFPDDEHSYTVNDDEYEKFAAMVAKRRQV